MLLGFHFCSKVILKIAWEYVNTKWYIAQFFSKSFKNYIPLEKLPELSTLYNNSIA